MTHIAALQLLPIVIPTLCFLYLLTRRESDWIGLYVALSFAITAWINGETVMAHLYGIASPDRKPMVSALVGCVLYLGGMFGALRAPTPLRTLIVALAAMETLFVGVVPVYRFAFGLDEGAYFAVNGQYIPNGIGFAITMLFAIAPMTLGIPWMLARQSATDKTIISSALSRYGMLSGIGVVAFMIFATCFVAWGYIGHGPFSGIPQRPAFDMAQTMVGPNTIFGMLMGAIIYLFWSFPKRFFDPVINLLEASQNLNTGLLEDIAHPLWRGVARNLDENRREALETQKELNQMRSLLLTFFNTSPADMYVKTVNGHLVYCSPGLAQVLGRTQEEMLGKHESDYHSPEQLERVLEIDAKLLREKKPIATEMYNAVSHRHEVQTRFPIFDEAGEITHIGGIFIDVTAAKAAEAALAQSRAQLSSLFEHVPAYISVFDADRKLVMLNRSAVELYNQEETKLLSMSIEDFRPYWPELDALQDIADQVVADAKARDFTSKVVRPDSDDFRIVSGMMFPIKGAGPNAVEQLGLFMIDVTEKVAAQGAAEKAQETLQAFFDNIPAMTFIISRDRKYVSVNSYAVRQNGMDFLSPEMLIGKPDITNTPKEWHPVIAEAHRKVIEEGKMVINEPSIDLPQGSFDLSVSRFPIRNAQGEVAFVGGLLFDRTAEKRAAQEIATSREALHQSEKLAALGQLLAGIAHELNNPLAIVLGRAAILKDKLADTPHADSIQKLRDAADRCAKIVKTFLAMARQTGPRRETVHINALIESALDMTAYGLRNAGIELVQELDPSLTAIEADEDQIIQLLINLVVNAQQALEEKEGKRRLAVRTSVDMSARQAVIEVADNGPGIAADVAARIFEPFFTTKGVGEGTGLGLSMCKGMIEAHGGTLTLHPTPGGGATFRATFPLPDSLGSRGDIENQPARKAVGNILIVDDEPEIAAILADCLAPLGVHCEIASEGMSALALIREMPFHAIFCDVRMPGMDGTTFLARLESEKPELASRLAFISGDVLHRDLVRLKAASDRPIIEKPFEPQSVRDIAMQLLSTAGDRP